MKYSLKDPNPLSTSLRITAGYFILLSIKNLYRTVKKKKTTIDTIKDKSRLQKRDLFITNVIILHYLMNFV